MPQQNVYREICQAVPCCHKSPVKDGFGTALAASSGTCGALGPVLTCSSPRGVSRERQAGAAFTSRLKRGGKMGGVSAEATTSELFLSPKYPDWWH